MRVERYEIVPDSGGPGRWRGGCGVERVWRILGGSSQVSVCCERTKSPPFGLAEGRAGGPARVAVVGPDGVERELNSKATVTLPPDGRLSLRAPEPAATARHPSATLPAFATTWSTATSPAKPL